MGGFCCGSTLITCLKGADVLWSKASLGYFSSLTKASWSSFILTVCICWHPFDWHWGDSPNFHTWVSSESSLVPHNPLPAPRLNMPHLLVYFLAFGGSWSVLEVIRGLPTSEAQRGSVQIKHALSPALFFGLLGLLECFRGDVGAAHQRSTAWLSAAELGWRCRRWVGVALVTFTLLWVRFSSLKQKIQS